MTRGRRSLTFADVRRVLLALPGVEEGLCDGRPEFRVRKKLVAFLKEDGGTLVVAADFDEREALMAADPEAFYFTDHYRNYKYVLVRLEKVDPGLLASVLEQSWRQRAPKRLAATRPPPPGSGSPPAAPSRPSRRRPRRPRG